MAAFLIDHYPEAALLDRLTDGVKSSNQEVVFLIGSALSAPRGAERGVPGVAGVISLIRNEFPATGTLLNDFDKEIAGSPNPYQSAFSFLIGRRGQKVANRIVRHAVACALRDNADVAELSDLDCSALERKPESWALNPAIEALGKLIADYPETFGGELLTTNFDPLAGVAIQNAGGHYYRTVLHRDGNLSQTSSTGCHVIHLHGFWRGADTLHTPRQLNQVRPRLKASLATIAKAKIVVVVGYSGWSDIFTDALVDLVQDDNAAPEILWTFFSDPPDPSERLLKKLSAGIDRGRVNFYAGIDCHKLFPELYRRWQLDKEFLAPQPRKETKAATFEEFVAHNDEAQAAPIHVADDVFSKDGDRPPLTEICVGRDEELEKLKSMNERACFITGFGGQGKSTIAATYFAQAQEDKAFDLFVWRDCKEEGERFENELIDIIVRLSGGRSSANYLAQQSMDTLAELIVKLSGSKRILFVFDNVDHYIELDKNKLSGNAHAFLSAYLNFNSSSRIIFTCRPDIDYPDERVMSFEVKGLDVQATQLLFERRGVTPLQSEVQEAVELTRGHAFWLDLIAAQISKKSSDVQLRDILKQISERSGPVPASIISAFESIWKTLDSEQKAVLQTMAETVRPETDQKLGDYLIGRLRFNRVSRALRALKDLNLVVIKSQRGSDDLFDLHPLVREYIKQTFHLKDRIGFINAICQVYAQIIGIYSKQLGLKRSIFDLQHWTQNAELLLGAEKYGDALECLHDVSSALYASDAPGEFSRVARILLKRIDWNDRADFKNFDSVFNCHFRILVNLGREAEYRDLLDRYKLTVPTKDARFINYCCQRAYMHWNREEFSDAVEWAQIGVDLKDKTNVDTRWTSSHELALAQRDGGQPNVALPYFLGSTSLEKVTDPDEFDLEKGESFYGNVGRCLHLDGKIDDALVCYRKSGLILQRAHNPHVENQGFIRNWIGELLVAKGDMCAAKTFFQAAEQKWAMVSPNRARQVNAKLDEIANQTTNCDAMRMDDLERYIDAWIKGRERLFIGG